MNKYILKNSNREVKLGDKLLLTVNVFGVPFPVEEITLDNNTLQDLINKGVIEVKSIKLLKIDDIIANMSSRIKWKPENIYKYLSNLYKINYSALYSTILKEISYILDKKYNGHISYSGEVWCISAINEEIVQVPKNKIKSYRNFSAFRTKEDALYAKLAIENILKNWYDK